MPCVDGTVHSIGKGDIYVLDNHDRHYLRGGEDTDLVLVSVFNPPLQGNGRHNLSGDGGSAY